MIKIFKFGSCRSSLGNYVSNNIKIIQNYDFTHTIKEIIQYLDIYDEIKNIDDFKYPEFFIYEYDKLNINYYKKMLNECDYILIELSSIKNNKYLDYYCQIDRLEVSLKDNNNYPSDIKNNLVSYKSTEESILHDLEIIKKRTNKKIILMGHINLCFNGFEPFKYNNYYCEQRDFIDKILKKTNEMLILYQEVFPQDTDWKIICSNQNDIYHISEYAYIELGKYLEKIIIIK